MIIQHIFQQRHIFGSVCKVIFLCLFSFSSMCFALGRDKYVDCTFSKGSFGLAQKDKLATLYVDLNDHSGVVRAVTDLQADIARVTGHIPKIESEKNDIGKSAVIIGTIGKSGLIDRLIKDGKVDVTQIAGRWESFLVQVVPNPLAGIESGLVIAGSDKRGTVYGIYDLSEQIGVSPWYWWADVPVEHKEGLFVKAGKYIQGPPAVKYRGIFINDEAPALSGWVTENYGGFNHKFYVKVFELLLRLKANYLWPAMWGKAFGRDDPLNPRLADEYGIVMGSSHCEPLLFNNDVEWDKATMGEWRYDTNKETVYKVLDKCVSERCRYENVYTVGMRGVHDEGMRGDLELQQQIVLLEQVFADQRKILTTHIDKKITEIPQVFIPYKEVLTLYDNGLKVPDDVTLMWCDDNWGNIRRLPTEDERKRSGGAGIYYHFDYVGGPRSYRWINTNPITKVWEQMNLAHHYGANRIWIVNVGDLKPMEFPMEFFLTLAWDPQRWPKEKISQYTELWAEREFGPKYASDIAEIVSKYTKYNGRRKPELLEPTTYSLVNYREAETVLADFKTIMTKAEQIYNKLPEEAKDAFFQLVLHPAKAGAIVTELYITTGENRLYAGQKRASTNDLAGRARALFKADAELSRYYNREMAKGKWNHIMDQTHIGYTSWNNPPQNEMPAVREIEIPVVAEMGVAVEGSTEVWPGSSQEPVLPEFSVFNQKERYIDIFNRGQEPFEFSATASAPWILLSYTKGTINKEIRIQVNIDWSRAPEGSSDGFVKITSSDRKEVNVKIKIFNPAEPKRDFLEGFVEADGYVSIEAEHYTKKIDTGTIRWEKIEDYGRTLSAMTIFPVTAQSVQPPEKSPCLEYKMYLFNTGTIEVEVIFAPTLNFVPGRGLRYAVSFDDNPPQIVNIVPSSFIAQEGNRDWENFVKDSAHKVKSVHKLSQKGYHALKIWMVDPGVVLQKIMVNTGGLRPSYLGPPESYHSGDTVFSKAVPAGSCGSGSGAFITGNYRNLFVEAGRCQDEVTAKINSAFEQLFYGDPSTQAVYFPAGNNANGPLAYICDVHNNDVRSEGMSYGMMVTVQLDKKAEFDALWNWAKTYMYHDSLNHPARGFFSWSVKTDGRPNDEMPAPDGEEYFAMSLYFAAGRWGSGEGIYDYQAEADELLTNMRHRKLITGSTVTGMITAGNIFHPDHKMVRFTPDIKNCDHTNPSYHLPAFYELWALWGPELDRSFWAEAASASRDFFHRVTHPITGLAPDFANFDGTPWASGWNSQSVHFQFDAWRTAMNWSFDWAWWVKDDRQRQLSDRLQAFFESKGMSDYGSRFTLEGSQLGGEHSAGLVAMNAVAGLAAAHPRAKYFVEELWNTPVPTGQYRYYDGMLYLLGMLHCSGEFRIWPPQQ